MPSWNCKAYLIKDPLSRLEDYVVLSTQLDEFRHYPQYKQRHQANLGDDQERESRENEIEKVRLQDQVWQGIGASRRMSFIHPHFQRLRKGLHRLAPPHYLITIILTLCVHKINIIDILGELWQYRPVLCNIFPTLESKLF